MASFKTVNGMNRCTTVENTKEEVKMEKKSFKTVNGMNRCTTKEKDGSTTLVCFAEFQNRKRYESLYNHHWSKWSRGQNWFQNRKRYESLYNCSGNCPAENLRMKFQNRKRYESLYNHMVGLQEIYLHENCFKTVNGMNHCTT